MAKRARKAEDDARRLMALHRDAYEFYRGRTSVFDEFDVFERGAPSAPTTPPTKKRTAHEKPRKKPLKNDVKFKALEFLTRRPGAHDLDQMAKDLSVNKESLRGCLWRLAHAGTVKFDGKSCQSTGSDFISK